jgi:hypothetical protein
MRNPISTIDRNCLRSNPIMKATKRLSIGPLLLLSYLSIPTQAEEAGKPIFNGKDLQGWQGMQGESTNWAVQDGVLTGTGGEGSQWLATNAEYDDFDLSLEFMLAKGGNSGLFIRAPREGTPTAWRSNCWTTMAISGRT